MSEIVAGVVAVNTFCRANSKYFAGYINYIDRDEATRKEHIKEFDLFAGYMEYMGNHKKTLAEEQPDHISGLFTADSDLLQGNEIVELKEAYKQAQKNGSLMWQTVLSFDNRWLADMGIYDEKTGILDEKRFKQAVRKSVGTMLQKENLQNGVWSAAIHFNTDNIHVHIATVEPEPMRQKKLYKQYEVIQVNGKWQYKMTVNPITGRKEKVHILKADGSILEKEEYVGRFKESSLKAMKRTMVEQLDQDKDINIRINALIRDEIVKNAKNYELYQDEEFRQAFLDIYHKLPEDKRLCHYGNSIMQPLRADLNALSMQYIEKYQEEEYNEFIRLLTLQAKRYKIAYGGEESSFYEKKTDDLFYRMGNAILGQMKELAKNKNQTEQEDLPMDVREMEQLEDFVDFSNEAEQEEAEQKERHNATPWKEQKRVVIQGKYLEWEPEFKIARRSIYKRENVEEAAKSMEHLAEAGNILAMYEMGNLYHFGRGVSIDEGAADKWYSTALSSFKLLEQSAAYERFRSYLEYRIGKQYYHGLGIEKDYEKAVEWLKKAENNSENGNIYAEYMLGNLYSQGLGVSKDTDIAVRCYEMAADRGNAYAQYKMGWLYEKGEWVEPDAGLSRSYYEKALNSLEQQDDKDDNMYYRIGGMYLHGKGTEVDLNLAAENMEAAADLGNDMAKYQLGSMLFYGNGVEVDTQRGIKYLKDAVEKNNVYAAYKLGRIFEDGEGIDQDLNASNQYYMQALKLYLEMEEKNDSTLYRIGNLYLQGKGTEVNIEEGIRYLTLAAEDGNTSAMYQLGKMYMSGDDVEKDPEFALSYFRRSADAGHAFAAYKMAGFYERGEEVASDPEAAYGYYADALKHFLAMGDKDHVLNYRIGMMYLRGKGTLADPQKALQYLEISAKQGNDMAMYQIGKHYLQNGKDRSEIEKGISWLLRSAEKQNQFAQYQLGMWARQNGDRKDARKWFTASAANGNEAAAKALYSLNASDKSTFLRNLRIENLKSDQDLRGALYSLQRSMQNVMEHSLNQQAYEQLQREIEAESTEEIQ